MIGLSLSVFVHISQFIIEEKESLWLKGYTILSCDG